MPAAGRIAKDDSLYSVLGLPEPAAGHPVSSAQIRVAFRRALLKHHPDKAARLLNEPCSKASTTRSQPSKTHDVDSICLARDTLLDSARRREYDNSVLFNNARKGPDRTVQNLHPTELETLDLDDMIYNQVKARWAKTCRCGNTKAYQVTEEDLEIASSDGGHEVLVGCGGCSLFVRVVFEAIDAE